ncbi:hypothetical protein NLU13_7940 [Sarocladium strictum]|uniref:Bromo domain-containing protein n=1 Tax=Sarocladium strictum TaxID=5046 RepID=A0AA39GF87_SARSR|nr:hypothetical protein NLU13_7940 [Sarocladium strictum]
MTPDDNALALVPEASLDAEEETRRALFADLYRKTEDRIALLFADDGSYNYDAIDALRRPTSTHDAILPPTTDHDPIQEPPLKKAKRVIDEDDYGDDDEDEEDDAAPPAPPAPKSQNISVAGALPSPSKSGSSPVQSLDSPSKSTSKVKASDDQQQSKKPDDAIKTLDDARIATEEAARPTTEDSEKQLQAEMDHTSNGNPAGAQAANQGSLSNANLGASSLTLKHLIARIDTKRDQVRASDAELRLLMNEVRKNEVNGRVRKMSTRRLYEALEKVLTELKAHTEYSTPFLSRVNKRSPDYYNSEFVTDLNLIWDNCLKYNQDMNHPLRRMANGMRKEAEKLIPLIPDLTIRSSRVIDQKPILQVNGLLKTGREGSEAVDGSNGFATPPIGGSNTPGGMNGPSGIASNADAMDIDGPTLNSLALNQAFGEAAEQAFEDEEYKI